MEHHITFLCDQQTLKLWSGKSLFQRCLLFHRRYPDLRISPTTLSSLYKKHQVKRKRIQLSKKSYVKSLKKQSNDLQQLKEKFRLVKQQGYNIIFVDETMFTYNTLYERDYSNKGENITVQEKALSGKTLAVVAAISLEKGIEHYQIFENSVNRDKFLLFLQNLKKKNQHNKISIFLDNFRVHHNKDIKKYCEEQGIPMIFNIPYSPEYNPIEQYFSLIKNTYKRLKINDIVNEENFCTNELIKQSFVTQTETSIKNICFSGHNKLINEQDKDNQLM